VWRSLSFIAAGCIFVRTFQWYR